MAENFLRSPRRKSRLSEDNRFRFTPNTSLKKAHRLWDRKPTTPTVPRSRAHKVWKRFLTSTSKDIVGNDNNDCDDIRLQINHDPFLTEINRSENWAVIRDVKRLRIGEDADYIRGRSFLETKWENETENRRRKYAMITKVHLPDCDMVESPPATGDEVEEDEVNVGHSLGNAYDGGNLQVEALKPTSIEGDQDIEHNFSKTVIPNVRDSNLESHSDENPESHLFDSVVIPAAGTSFHANGSQIGEEDGADMVSTSLDLNEDAGQPSTIEKKAPPTYENEEAPMVAVSLEVADDDKEKSLDPASGLTGIEKNLSPLPNPPHLKIPSLDGDDAEFISDFISKAKAKRAANSAALELKDAVDCKIDPVPCSPNPKARRVLEDLDKNSPRRQESPVQTHNRRIRQQERSATVHDSPKKSKTAEDEVRPIKKQLRSATLDKRNTGADESGLRRQAPRIPDQIPVRRAKGTEFIFTKRSDAQQLALTTKANTRRNKGNSQPPHLLLPDINDELTEDVNDDDELPPSFSSRQSRRHPQTSAANKQVRWKGVDLVEFCEDETPDYDSEISDVSTKDTRRTRNCKKTGGETGPAKSNSTSSSLSTPTTTRTTRKMRKLVGSKHTDVHPDDSSSPPVTRIKLSIKSSSSFPGTPIRGRRAASTLTSSSNNGKGILPLKNSNKLKLGDEREGDSEADARKRRTNIPCPTLRKRMKI